jgi:hypothetical protein
MESDLALESAAKNFRAQLSAIDLLEKTAEAASSGDISGLETLSDSCPKLDDESLEMMDSMVRGIVDKSLIYILLENGIKRIDAHALLNSFNDMGNLPDYLNEEMIDQDPDLIDRIATSLHAFERLVLRFSLFKGKEKKLGEQISSAFLTRFVGLREALYFLDVDAKYSKVLQS